jgi:poly(A) polymerase
VEVIRVLRRAGHQAVLAGGCVRDMLLGIRPADYDVATSARPEQVKALFRHVLMVGAKFGVAMVIFGRRKVEVATFRSDVSYTDGRRPDQVHFSDGRRDALRRDFTINGMFHDPLAGTTIDYVGGRRDLRRKVIRAIGQPEHRFDEDHLRMLRAVRFSVRFGFAIEPATALAIRHHAGRIVRISGERVREELEKMLARPSAPQALEQLHELGLLQHILPELFGPGEDKTPQPGQPKDALWPSALRRVRLVARRCDVEMNLAALLGELDRHQIEAIARRWGASNRLREDLVWLAAHLRDWQKMPTAELAAVKILMAGRQFARLRILWRLDERLRTGGVACNRRIAARIRRIPTGQVAPAPLVSGADLKGLGLSEGPRLGRILAALYRAQLNEGIATRAQAMDLAAGLIGKE